MNSVRRVCAIAVAFSLGFAGGPAQAANVEQAPNVLLPFVDGNSAELGEWLGVSPIYLKIWATWCSTCREEMPHFRGAYDKHKDSVAFFSVNAGFNDTVDDVREFNARYGLQMPSVVDVTGEIGQAFDLIATPYHVLIDADGKVIHKGHAASESVDRLLARMAREQGGRAVPGTAAKSAQVPAPDVPRTGDVAPPFSIETLSGQTFSVSGEATATEPVFLFFFTTWCEPYLAGAGDDQQTANACRDARRAIEAALAVEGGRPRVLGIASRMWTGEQELAGYRERFRPPYPLALDETNEIFRGYGVRRFPTLVVISGGRIEGRYTGALDELPRT